MADNEPGWSSSPLASGIAPRDAWTRMQYGRYGGRSDDIIAYGMQGDNVMNPSSGLNSRSSGGGSTYPTGSGAVKMKFSGGNTPSNPGGYNYGTLNNTIGGAASTIKWGFNTRSKLRDYKNTEDTKQRVKDAREWNTEVLPVQLASFAKEQKDFNQSRSPATGKPSKAKNAKPLYGPAKPNINLNPIKP